MNTTIDKKSKKIWESTVFLQNAINRNFNTIFQSYMDQVRKLIDSVVLTSFNKEQQAVSIYFAWKAAEELNKIIVCANKEICEHWATVYNFLKDEVANDVIAKNNAKEAEVQDVYKVLDKVRETNNLETYWSMEMPKNAEGKVDFNIPYPVEVKRVIYTETSGWGQSNIVKLPDNPTYLDVYKAVNEAIVKSGDLHHVFIEGLRHVNVSSIIVTGS